VSTRTAEAEVARRPGRPRSEQADQAIIAAALSLFAESGPEGLCIERVAARAGVGKATIYRRWPGKEDLLLDAIAAVKAPLPEPAGRSAREDLVTLLGAMCRETADPRRARQFALLRGGIATGELRPDLDVDAALFMLTGAVVARRGHEQSAIPPDYPERVVDELLRGLAAR
jgi:AcrR family transcriptional regulator